MVPPSRASAKRRFPSAASGHRKQRRVSREPPQRGSVARRAGTRTRRNDGYARGMVYRLRGDRPAVALRDGAGARCSEPAGSPRVHFRGGQQGNTPTAHDKISNHLENQPSSTPYTLGSRRCVTIDRTRERGHDRHSRSETVGRRSLETAFDTRRLTTRTQCQR